MKRMLDIVKKHDNIIILIWIIIMVTTITFNIQIEANDELWNFSNIYKMYNGYTIYQDLNVIITPLFFFVGKILFLIFGANYFTFRIYQTTIIYTLLFFLIYQLFKKLKVSKMNSILYTTIICITCISVLIDASYNMLAIAFVVLGMYNLTAKKGIKLGIIQATIIFLIFLTKQNIAVYYMLALLFYQLIIENKKKSEKIKLISIEIATLTLLLLMFYMFMQSNGIWENFINYTFLGIGEFAQKNVKVSVVNILLVVIETVITIAMIIITYNKKIPFGQKQKNNIRVLGIFSLAMLIITYPIFNSAHTIIASINFMIFICYIMNTIALQEILSILTIKNILKRMFIILVLGMIGINMCKNIPYCIEIMKKDYYFKDSPYYGAIATKEKLEEIQEIVNYIKQENEKGIEVKIISYYSNLYMNILNKNNGDMDLPFYGNLGKTGEDGMIQKIEKLRNANILILTQEDNIYQESKKVMKYIQENLKYKGTIRQFSIYETK